MSEKHNEMFEYTYSAAQQEEIEKIRSKYLPKEETKMDKLRKLDASVTKPGTIWSIAFGVIGCLMFGGGMSCTLLQDSDMMMLTLGVFLGLIGILLIAIAYPVYKKVTEKERAHIAPQILALSEEIEAESHLS